MTGHDAFIATICQAPHEDAPRLVYADWLEERGDPRAEFIRAQVELAELREPEWLTHGDLLCKTEDESILDHCVGCLATGTCGRPVVFCRWHELTKRSDELLAAYNREWAEFGLPEGWAVGVNQLEITFYFCPNGAHCPANTPSPLPHVEFNFRRGFPELLTCRWEEWTAHHEALIKAMPVTKVTLTTRIIANDGYRLWRARGFPKSWLPPHDSEYWTGMLKDLWPGIEFVLPSPIIDMDAPLFELQELLLPIIHSDFWFSNRTLAEARG